LYCLNKKLKYHLFAYWHDPRWKGFVGASVKIKDMAYNLAAMGNDVIIFLPKNRFKQEEFVHKIIEIPFIDLSFLRLITFNIFLLIFLIIQLFKNSPSVVYVRRMNSVIPALYAKVAKAALIYEINDDPYSKNNMNDSNCISVLRSLISAKQDQIILKICDKAFVITKEILDKLHKYNQNLKRNKLEIMPSGANMRLFKPLDKIQCRSQLKFQKENKIVCFAGTLLEHQGIGILIEAAAQITKKYPETIFLIIG
jgi:glycosyltransferase involved in cell wall biosynthesis